MEGRKVGKEGEDKKVRIRRKVRKIKKERRKVKE